MTLIEGPVRIFVGTDRSQMIGFKVLEYSLKRHTDLPIEMVPLIDLDLPEPRDPRQRQRTGFSFARFAIPKLAGYRGRALYTDADMLVFKDIRELWTLPFNGAKVIVQEELPSDIVKVGKDHSPKQRIKQCSVMLLDCSGLNWDVDRIVRGLDNEYTYEDLMQRLCILSEDEVSYGIPFRWNSLEHFDETTCLIHYTDMPTQPWVSAENPNGWIWSNEVRRMLEAGVLTFSDLEEERKRGYLRPSFLTEIKLLDDSRKLTPEQVRALSEEDSFSGFVKHAELNRSRQMRITDITTFERASNFGSEKTSPKVGLIARAKAMLLRGPRARSAK